jgi:hypothetical protein
MIRFDALAEAASTLGTRLIGPTRLKEKARRNTKVNVRRVWEVEFMEMRIPDQLRNSKRKYHRNSLQRDEEMAPISRRLSS